MTPPPVIQLHSQDNVGVAAQTLAAGADVLVGSRAVRLRQPIPFGHKVALEPIAAGTAVRKYGQPIGAATAAIEPGDWVHVHNLADARFDRDYAPASESAPALPTIAGCTFSGYHRPDGRVGTRNYVAILSTVNCSATVCKAIARHFGGDRGGVPPGVDGVIALTHGGGCGIPFAGAAHEVLHRVLGGMARHPNIGAYLIVGLGCEQALPGYLVEQQRLVQLDPSAAAAPPGAPLVLTMQDLGGTTRTVERGVELTAELLPKVAAARRAPAPASKLLVALECGGSDGNSGITANPAVGAASDLVVACGGTTVFSETPEIYGAEHLLTRRAVNSTVAEQLLQRIRFWEWYVGVWGAELANNPSPGNKEGGITTIAEKSLGAVAKGGSAPLQAVYQYAEPITARGLCFMDTPGYDPVSVTGMVAGGATVVVFTTGRGSCFGCKPAPTIKVATNTPMFERMRDDMDLDAGRILHGASIQQVGRELFEMILAVAGGQTTCSERLGVGDDEFLPWQLGPTL